MSKVKHDALILQALAIPGWYETYVAPKIQYTDNGCWIWVSSRGKDGYAQIHLPRYLSSTRVCVLGSRVVWLHIRGEIPSGYVLDHDDPNGCSNKACVNPACLQAVTSHHNSVLTGHSISAQNAKKTQCSQGHPLIANITPSMTSRRRRGCHQCALTYKRERSRRVSAAAQHLGLTWRAYVSIYGQSFRVAQSVLDSREKT